MKSRGVAALALLAAVFGYTSEGPPRAAAQAADFTLDGIRTDSLLNALRTQDSFSSPQNLPPVTFPLSVPTFSNPFRTQIVIRFREGSAVRLRGAALTVDDAAAAFELWDPLTRTPNSNAVREDLAELGRIILRSGGELISAGGEASENDLADMRRDAESFARRAYPDLNLYYYLLLDSAENADEILAKIQSLDSVESAYYQPIPVSASDIPPRTTLSLSAEQGYLNAAPHGIDVEHARSQPGGSGEGIRIIDIEFGWRPQHEDFPDASRILIDSSPCGEAYEETPEHGTAVIGTLWAQENGFGATGIVPRAEVGRISPWQLSPQRKCYYGVAAALTAAAGQARRGDIVLIEQEIHRGGRLVAVEHDPVVFDAIVTLTGMGIVVVEAAGNGGKEFVRDPNRDSGAIMVAAGHPDTRAALAFSNHGSRMDVQGWGQSIATLGLGERPLRTPDPRLRIHGNDPLQWYTTEFNGTSGAAPIVAGAAAIIQANRLATGLAPLNSRAMRTLLHETGTPQGSSNLIGPLPNLRTALAASPSLPGQVGRR